MGYVSKLDQKCSFFATLTTPTQPHGGVRENSFPLSHGGDLGVPTKKIWFKSETIFFFTPPLNRANGLCFEKD